MLKIVRNFTRSHIYIYIYIGIAIFLASLISLGLIFNSNINSAHAANPQSVDYNVYVKPSLSIRASSDTVTIDLNPNSKAFGTANLDVTVGTNNLYGYKLFMNSTNSIGDNDTNLVRNDSLDGVITNATIPTLSSTTTQSSFPSNKWGYRLNNNNVGGDSGITDTTATNFYPYTNTPNPPVISSSNSATNEQTANLTFGAKIDYTKPAGQYDLTLKFKALPIVSTYYMQDIAADPTLATSVCTEEPTVVLDKRDEQSYTIRRINGDCWMVENLLFTGTELDSTTSNVAAQYTPANPYRVNGGNGYEDLTSGDSYDKARIHVGTIASGTSPIDDNPTSQSNIPTVWYNYPAASAGTITGEPNTDPQLYDICPAGWKLPTNAEFDAVIPYQEQFNLVKGGSYYNSTINDPTSGRWWASNRRTQDNYRAKLTLISTGLSVTSASIPYGFYVRCIMKPANITNFSFMQDFAKVTSAEKTAIINNSDEHQTAQLIDARESNTNSYWVGKLKDGKVWMIQNLKLGSSGSSVTLTSTDSNISSSSWTLNDKVAAPGKFGYTNCPAGSCEDRNTDGTYYNDGNQYYCTPISGDSNQYVGCYYNWYSATASSGTSSITPVGTSVGYKDVSSSICPKGWYLPSGGGTPLSGSTPDRPDSDFNMLYNNYPSAEAMLVANPTTTYDNADGTYLPGFLLTGRHLSNGGNNVGVRAIYWSRSAYSKGAGYSLSISGSTVNAQDWGSKYSGFPIRCVTYPN